jgi:hypothetical protein
MWTRAQDLDATGRGYQHAPARQVARRVGAGRHIHLAPALPAWTDDGTLEWGAWFMLATFRYSLLPFLFFPAVLVSTWQGGYWPLAYIAFAVAAYVLSDNFTPPLTGVPEKKHATANNLFLLLQIPLSAALVLLLVLKLGADSAAMRWLASTTGLSVSGFGSPGQALAACVAVGFHLSSNTVVAHEFMHRRSAFWKGCSRILLTLVGDAHFQEAHVYGHHANVGTARDPASARRGEPFYRFLLRSTVGQWREAYAFERHRLRGHGWFGRLMRNRPLRGNLTSLELLWLALLFLGPGAAAGYLLVMIIAKVLLEAINYVQHYGLAREPGTKVEARNSWDSTSRGSSLILFNLTRHADHHQHPGKPFWELENPSGAPQLVRGYMLSIGIALIPPLWFRYMDPLPGAQLEAREES